MAATLDEVQGHGGTSSKWENMVRWARNALADKGYLLRPNSDISRGLWKLTEQGMLAAEGLGSDQPTKAAAIYPDEVAETYPEGAKYTIRVNAYERNTDARKKCLAHYGYRCAVCDFDFEHRYGQRGKEFIHVHHLVPVSSIGQAYEVDPIMDLRPVCPNCHAMLHRTNPPCGIDELAASLQESQGTSSDL